MPNEIGIIYYCEGAGHAMRTLAVAQQLEKRGLEVKMTGGGPGEKFLELNGRSDFSPTVIKPGTRMHSEGLISALTHLPGNLVQRARDINSWLKENDPDIVLADGPLAAFVASLTRRRFYFLNHWDWKLPESRVEKLNTFFVNSILSFRAEKIFSPAIWEDISDRAIRVGPLAPEGGEKNPELDILVVPTDLGDVTEKIVEELESEGYNTVKVGSEDWTHQPSLQPYLKEADYVVCSGYSTIMEASVAGTPVIIVPYTSEQRGIAKSLDGKQGFRKFSGDILQDLEQVGPVRQYENGAIHIAEEIAENLEKRS